MLKRVLTLAAALGLFVGIGSSVVSAEQIRLANGQFIQGEVIDSNDKGFTFKLTESGGKVRLGWDQIHADDARRLRKVVDPDAGIVFVVMVNGARLELVNGEILEGYVDEVSGGYRVRNLKHKAGREVARDEVDEEGYQKDIQIDARAVMDAPSVLKLRMKEAPPATAQDYYALARLAERLGLYRAPKDPNAPKDPGATSASPTPTSASDVVYAKELVALCLANGPSARLQAAAEALNSRLDELIEAEAILKTIDEARALAATNQFGLAIAALDGVLKLAAQKPTIVEILKPIRDEIDLEFTMFVGKEWSKTASTEIGKWLKENKEATVQEGVAFVRSQLDMRILTSLSEISKAEPRDVLRRMRERDAKLFRVQTASFTKAGWYELVGGPLPNAGNMPVDNGNGNGNGNRGGGDFPPGFPGGNRGGNRGGGGNSGAGGDRDGIADADDGLQEGGRGRGRGEGGGGGGNGTPPDISKESVEDYIKKIAEEAARRAAAGQEGDQRGKAKYDKDDPNLKVPKNTPSLADWFEKAGSTTKRKWLFAMYVRASTNLVVVEERYEKISFR